MSDEHVDHVSEDAVKPDDLEEVLTEDGEAADEPVTSEEEGK